MSVFNLIRKERLLFVILLASLVVIIFYLIVGYLNSYIGYYGYDKEKYRRFSATMKESLERKVFVKNLNFSIDSVSINSIFIETAYKWGSSSEQTTLLSERDTFKNNEPSYPYQIVISFKEKQGLKKVFIPRSTILLKDSLLQDTIFIDVYVRDSLYNLDKKEVLKIWWP